MEERFILDLDPNFLTVPHSGSHMLIIPDPQYWSEESCRTHRPKESNRTHRTMRFEEEKVKWGNMKEKKEHGERAERKRQGENSSKENENKMKLRA